MDKNKLARLFLTLLLFNRNAMNTPCAIPAWMINMVSCSKKISKLALRKSAQKNVAKVQI